MLIFKVIRVESQATVLKMVFEISRKLLATRKREKVFSSLFSSQHPLLMYSANVKDSENADR